MSKKEEIVSKIIAAYQLMCEANALAVKNNVVEFKSSTCYLCEMFDTLLSNLDESD